MKTPFVCNGWLPDERDYALSDIEFEGLALRTCRTSHDKYLADLVGKADRYRHRIAEVAGIIVDLG